MSIRDSMSKVRPPCEEKNVGFSRHGSRVRWQIRFALQSLLHFPGLEEQSVTLLGRNRKKDISDDGEPKAHRIREVHRKASSRFREKHAVSIGPNRIADRMLFCIATGMK